MGHVHSLLKSSYGVRFILNKIQFLLESYMNCLALVILSLSHCAPAILNFGILQSWLSNFLSQVIVRNLLWGLFWWSSG